MTKEEKKDYMAKWYLKNKEARQAYELEYRIKNKEKIKAKQKLSENRQFAHVKKYGLSKEDYTKLLEAQNGRCKICGIEASLLKAKLHIDHNHETNRVRGLLCRACNHGVGNFREDVALLSKAITYILENNN